MYIYVCSGTDSWDTYDTDFVPDCLSIQFAQSSGTQFTCFTSTKVKILAREERVGFSVPASYDRNATTSKNYRRY